MKKLILPFVALLIGMAACQKEDTNVLTLEVEHYNGDAKMHIDNQDFTVWDDGDTVWLSGNPRRVTVDNDNNRATISAQDIYSRFYASYPYTTTESGHSAGRSYTIRLPQVQKYRENSHGQQIVAAPMFAYAEYNPEVTTTLTFRNIGSVLAVKVLNNTYDPLSVHSIQVIADNQNLWGEKTSYAHDINTFALDNLADGGKTVTLDCGDGVEVPAEGKVFYIALPVISGAKLTVKVDDGYGIYTLAQTNNTATFDRNTLHQVPFSASEDICEFYAARPYIIKYTATSKLSGFEEEANVWGKTIVRHVYDATRQRGTITFNSAITEVPLRAFEYNGALLSIILPESVETIGKEAFYECGSLTSVSMPGVKVVRDFAFAYCSTLTTLNLPSITRIDANAFFHSGIQTITFGPDLSSLGTCILASCDNLQHIYCKAQTPPTSDVEFLEDAQREYNNRTWSWDVNRGTTLHVPTGTKEAYYNHPHWQFNGYQGFDWDHIVDDITTD